MADAALLGLFIGLLVGTAASGVAVGLAIGVILASLFTILSHGLDLTAGEGPQQ